MQVPSKAVAEFKQLMKDNYDIELSDAEAEDQARDLLMLEKLALGKRF